MRWRFTFSSLLLGCLVLIGGCDKKEEAKAEEAGDKAEASPWDGLCDAYVEMCPDKKGDLEACKEYCNAERYAEKEEMCTFMFCGRETKMCDNQEEGDTTVMACIDKTPWKD